MKSVLRPNWQYAVLRAVAMASLIAGAAAVKADDKIRDVKAGAPAKKKDLKRATKDLKPTLYVVGYSHLDTEWCWTYPQVIREFLANTLHDNFKLIEKYPGYVFNWTGSNRYRMMKQYYPAEYAQLKKYVAAGRWFPAGSSVEEGDVNSPSAESLIRQVMYGNQFFRREFGKASEEYMLPDCFGFPASLPSILAHCGLKGFSTQKLTWGSAVGIPFNVGVWEGPDGQSIVSALNPGAYDSKVTSDLSRSDYWMQRVEADGLKTGVPFDYRYYGTGDVGGAPDDSSVKFVQESLTSGGPLAISAGEADQMFLDLTPSEIQGLPKYKGDLELTQHSAGSLTSEATQKRWNHENEQLADATERASVGADLLGVLPYDRDRITDAWLRFLPGQFHDLMAGTALPMAYNYSWNDEVIAMNEFSGVLRESVGGVARELDTQSKGVSVIVYNPLSAARQDVAEATLSVLPRSSQSFKVVGPDGRVVPSQVVEHSGNTSKILFLASAPSVGYAVYDVQTSDNWGPKPATGLKVTRNSLENDRYQVRLNGQGDVSSIYDKKAKRQLLSAPARLEFQYENPTDWPAWNMDWADQKKAPRGYVDGPATITVVENGPVRVAIQVTRRAGGSSFVQTIRLAAGKAGDRVEFSNKIDWHGKECALKAAFPLTVSNPKATYNWGLGTVERGNNDPKKYEVGSHDWFDLTNASGDYGVSVLDVAKYGSDKPNDNTLRLTLLYTPGTHGGYQHQGCQDWGRHEILYAVTGHEGDWRHGTQDQADRLNQPLETFEAPKHSGKLGRAWSVVDVSSPQISVQALKKAEDSDEVVVRVRETAGQPASNVHLKFASPVVSAREVDGQEREIGRAAVSDGQLVVELSPYRVKAFAVRLQRPTTSSFMAPFGVAVDLPFNIDVVSSAQGKVDGKFDSAGRAIPGELLPPTLTCDGVEFHLGPTGPGQRNAVSCHGQVLHVPAGVNRKLYFVAASSGEDTPAVFRVLGEPVSLSIQSWEGFIGQWDTRAWGGVVPEEAYDWSNPLVGLSPGYIKRAPVAWYADHRRLPNGENDPYAFCYLFRYAINLPDGADSVTLPFNDKVRILAATVAVNANEETKPLEPLYDVLDRSGTSGPVMTPEGGSAKDSLEVKVSPAFYWSPTDRLKYTTDGSLPTAYSPTVEGSVEIFKPTTLRVAEVDPQGHVGTVTTDHFEVHDTTPPKVIEATGLREATMVRLTFSERVDRHSAEDVNNYPVLILDYAPNATTAAPSAKKSQAIESATLLADGKSVVLRLKEPLLTRGKHSDPDTDSRYITYLLVNGVKDLSPAQNAVQHQLVEIEPVTPSFLIPEVATFDGANTVLKRAVPDLPTQGSSPWTINMFVKADEPFGDLSLVAGFGSGRDDQGAERFLIKNRGDIFFWGSNVDIDGGAPYDIGKWQMITATFDGKSVRLYKNGMLLSTAEASLSDARPDVRLAPPPAWEYGHRFKGKIAGFSIWHKALPVEYVKVLLNGMPKD